MDSEYMVEKVVQALIATRQHEDRILAIEKEVDMVKRFLLPQNFGEGSAVRFGHCSNCGYWFNSSGEKGRCFRYPPINDIDISTYAQSGCGEWRAKNER